MGTRVTDSDLRVATRFAILGTCDLLLLACNDLRLDLKDLRLDLGLEPW